MCPRFHRYDCAAIRAVDCGGLTQLYNSPAASSSGPRRRRVRSINRLATLSVAEVASSRVSAPSSSLAPTASAPLVRARSRTSAGSGPTAASQRSAGRRPMPSRSCKSPTDAVTLVLAWTTAGDWIGLNSTLELALSAAAWMRVTSRTVVSEIWCRDGHVARLLSPSRCPAKSSGAVSSTRSSSKIAMPSCSWKQRPSTASQSRVLASASVARLHKVGDRRLPLEPLRERVQLEQRVSLGVGDRSRASWTLDQVTSLTRPTCSRIAIASSIWSPMPIIRARTVSFWARRTSSSLASMTAR